MRLGTTLCLHLNNPRARGYAYPRDFVLPSTHTHTHIHPFPLYRVHLSRLRSMQLARAYFPVETENAAPIPYSNACVYIYIEKESK